eukprot:15478963-Alexandrium_andersonii.AAC.1
MDGELAEARDVGRTKTKEADADPFCHGQCHNSPGVSDLRRCEGHLTASQAFGCRTPPTRTHSRGPHRRQGIQ